MYIGNRFRKDWRKIVAENCTRFKKVTYKSLNARQKELFNFQKIAATLADCGFNCIKLADDWQGADFLAYHVNDTITLKVQLKSRLTIDRKYCDKDIWMAFPHEGYWYLIEHHQLVEKVGKHTRWLNSDSWKNKGGYSSISINADLLKSLAEDRLGPVYGPVLAV
jgi:frataxin-like iron-binding protein CyaY